jgi:hypothetical protein
MRTHPGPGETPPLSRWLGHRLGEGRNVPKPSWTDRHTEVAEYLVIRGVSIKSIAAILGFTPTTVMRYVSDVLALRTDYRARLVHNCGRDLDLLGVDRNHALAVILEAGPTEDDP